MWTTLLDNSRPFCLTVLTEFTPPNLEPTCCWRNADLIDQRKHDAAEHVHNAVATGRAESLVAVKFSNCFQTHIRFRRHVCLLQFGKKTLANLHGFQIGNVIKSGSKTSISQIAWTQETQDNRRSSGCSKKSQPWKRRKTISEKLQTHKLYRS